MHKDLPLEERAKELRLAMAYDGLSDYLEAMAEHFGKDAVMKVAIEDLALEERGQTERIAEIAFDLVPGQVRRVYKTTAGRVEIPVLPEMKPWEESEPFDHTFESRTIDIQRWVAQMAFGFDEESGTLIVRDM